MGQNVEGSREHRPPLTEPHFYLKLMLSSHIKDKPEVRYFLVSTSEIITPNAFIVIITFVY